MHIRKKYAFAIPRFHFDSARRYRREKCCHAANDSIAKLVQYLCHLQMLLCGYRSANVTEAKAFLQMDVELPVCTEIGHCAISCNYFPTARRYLKNLY